MKGRWVESSFEQFLAWYWVADLERLALAYSRIFPQEAYTLVKYMCVVLDCCMQRIDRASSFMLNGAEDWVKLCQQFITKLGTVRSSTLD